MGHVVDQTMKVFIVEDYEDILAVYVRLLRSIENLTVCGTGMSAEEALPKIGETHPDLLITDISLPGMTGIDLVQHVRPLYPGLKILVLSGYDREMHARAALDAGANEVASKNEDFSKILTTIRRLLNLGESVQCTG